MEKLTIREDYAPKPSEVKYKDLRDVSSEKNNPEIDNINAKMELFYKNIMERLDVLQNKIDQQSKSETEMETIFSKAKNEFISALQCEMEINRQYIIREVQRMNDNGGLKTHGDHLFF